MCKQQFGSARVYPKVLRQEFMNQGVSDVERSEIPGDCVMFSSGELLV
jgi:hypothetical protein